MCEGDFDEDGDMDGEDLIVQIADGSDVDLEDFAADFGRIECPQNLSFFLRFFG